MVHEFLDIAGGEEKHHTVAQKRGERGPVHTPQRDEKQIPTQAAKAAPEGHLGHFQGMPDPRQDIRMDDGQAVQQGAEDQDPDHEISGAVGSAEEGFQQGGAEQG